MCVRPPHAKGLGDSHPICPWTEGQRDRGARRLPPAAVSVESRDEIQQGTKRTLGPLTLCHGQHQLLLSPELRPEPGRPTEAAEQGSQDPPAPWGPDLHLQEKQPKVPH